ncbi:hypothetical protein F5B20DRAFT_14844 [Whalleya microplaca]|nr:hypothetical protein F5B20DRAFT_14844 [Whalleya microplaca]
MADAHETFKALGPVNWDDIANAELPTFLTNTFSEAQCLIDSIPVSQHSSTQKQGRPRSATDPNLPTLLNRESKPSDRARVLRKEWKEVKVNPRENPLGLDVYKLAAKDGKGAWFARRSIHEGLTFEKWKLGMEREFPESMKVNGKPGDGNVRGIGADKRVVNQTVEGCGKVHVYQLSAQFPGPTTPRDFVTLALSTDAAIDAPIQNGKGKLRHFMVVSKPCVHPECPQRQGFIRGQYESVEYIREIKVEKALRKTHSSVDLPRDELMASARASADSVGKEAMIRSARQATMTASSTHGEEARKRGKTISFAGTEESHQDDEDYDTVIEWIMVTRSDPGGSVPRFLIERGTPAGIAGDADKFLRWISSKSLDDFAESDDDDTRLKQDASRAEEIVRERKGPIVHPTSNLINNPSEPLRSGTEDQEEMQPGPGGFYGMISGALGAAASLATSRIPNPFGSVQGGDTDSSDPSPEVSDDASSIHSFHSLEAEETNDPSPKPEEDTSSLTNGGVAESTRSAESSTVQSAAPSQHEKELRKLEERRRKTEEKMQRAQERQASNQAKQGSDEVAKLRAKHEREVAKQQEKYERELRKLEAKRAAEQRKAEDRARKAAERQDKANLALELDKARAERDVARKQVDILKEQVGELQTQNTMLVARLGREGVSIDGGSAPLIPGLKRSLTDQVSERGSRKAESVRS